MSRYFQDERQPGLLRLYRFGSADELLGTWPDTRKVHLPIENIAAAYGIRHEAFFRDDTSARFDVTPNAELERGLYVARFRYWGKTPAVRVWVRVTPIEDWYGGPRYCIQDSRDLGIDLEVQEPLDVRRLTVSVTGDAWKGTVQPHMRFGGVWLREAGFEPKDKYLIEVLGNGELMIRKEAT
jgi:hypothetical protein